MQMHKNTMDQNFSFLHNFNYNTISLQITSLLIEYAAGDCRIRRARLRLAQTRPCTSSQVIPAKPVGFLKQVTFVSYALQYKLLIDESFYT